MFQTIYPRPVNAGRHNMHSYMPGALSNVHPTPPPPPPSNDTDESFYTALTQPVKETPEDNPEEEEDDVQPEDPFKYLWGRLVPCNPNFNNIDLIKERPLLKIGRLPTNDLILNSGKISGHHCQIEVITEGGGDPAIRVYDTSTNGTYINGGRIKKRQYGWLRQGDELSFGLPNKPGSPTDDFRFIFRVSTEPISTRGFYSQWHLGAVLGNGSFATVYKAYSKISGGVAAVKMIAKSRFAHNPKTQEMFERELAIMQNLSHHNITRLIEYFEDQSTLYIVMELVHGGDMLEYILKNGAVPEADARTWTRQMVDALWYTHRKGIAHRDLKPENILLTLEPNRRVKLADFGLAKKEHSKSMLVTMCGTPSYLAPEVILGNDGVMGYEKVVDCWSLGVIVFAMLTNTNCFNDSESQDLRTKMANRHVQWDVLRAKGVSDECMDFVQKLIVADPKQRMSMKHAKRHPWIRDVPNEPPAGFHVDLNFSQPEEPSQSNESQTSGQPLMSQGPQTTTGEADEDPDEAYTRAGTEAAPDMQGFSGPDYGRSKTASAADPALAYDMADLNLETDTVNGGGGETDNGGSFVHTSAGPSPQHRTSVMDVDEDESWEKVANGATPKNQSAASSRTSVKRKAQVIDEDPVDVTPPVTSKGAKAKVPRTVAATRARPALASPPATTTKTTTKRRPANRIRAPSPSDDDEPPVAGPSTRRAPAPKSSVQGRHRPARQLEVKAQRVR